MHCRVELSLEKKIRLDGKLMRDHITVGKLCLKRCIPTAKRVY